MQQIDGQLIFTVCESAQIAKVTAFFRRLRAKLGLVLLGMIEGFDAVVSLGAELPFWTLISLRVTAHLRRVGTKHAPLILLMVVEALLLVMTSLTSARLRLEDSKVEQGDTPVFALACGSGRSSCAASCR